MNTPVLTAIASPFALMGASWKATATNVSFLMLALLMLPDFALLSSLVFVGLQLGAIACTYRDCHFMDVFLASLKCKPTPMILKETAHRYVG